MCSLPCLYLDLYVGVLLAMFMCLDLHVGCYTMCFYNPFCLLLYLFISMFVCLDLGFAMICALRGLCLLVFGATCWCGCNRPFCGLFGCNCLWECILVILFFLTHTLSPLRVMSCLPCLLCATRLAFFASLHLFTYAYMFMHKSLLACVIKPNSYYLVQVHTCLSYTRPRVPFRNFIWWHMCHPYSNFME